MILVVLILSKVTAFTKPVRLWISGIDVVKTTQLQKRSRHFVLPGGAQPWDCWAAAAYQVQKLSQSDFLARV